MPNDKQVSPIDSIKPSKNSGFDSTKAAIIPRTIPSPAKVYTTNIGRSRIPSLRWERPEWDLAECGRIIDTESYVRRGFKNKKNLFVKEGYSFAGKQPERLKYIRKRLLQMEEASGVPFKILMAQTFASLIRCSNAFWVKVRKDNASGGKQRINANGKTLKPVAAYFMLAAETIRFKRDEYGKIKEYQQEIAGKTVVTFRPEDVIHFYLNKREGYAVGTPDVVTIKDDVRALRRIEENVELLIYQHLFPLFHYKVGTEKQPAATYANGNTEVDEVAMKVASMPSDGCWVTPERHEVKAISAGPPPINVEKIIEHFKQRIYVGLGNSSVDMGEGGAASRSTAQTMSRNLIDDTKADQIEIADQFQSFVIRELLLESTFPSDSVLEEDNMVELKFKEIDFESRQAKENHYVDLYLKNAITHDEMRIELGYDPFIGEGWPTSKDKSTMFQKGQGEWGRTNYGLIERDKIILQSIDEPGTDASKELTKSTIKSNESSSAGGNSIANKSQPENQHGKRSSAKINKDSFEKTNTIPELRTLFLLDPPIKEIYDDIHFSVVKEIRDRGYSSKTIQFIIDSRISMGKDKLVGFARKAYRIGLASSNAKLWDVRYDLADAHIEDHINRYVIKLQRDLLNSIKRNTIKSKNLKNQDSILVDQVFKALRHRTSMIDNSEIMRAFNYGKASGYKVMSADKMKVERHETTECALCDGNTLFSGQSDAIIYNELPPFHPNCTCTVEVGP